ncbi:hypothetical protein CLAFUW4_09214 [Fulvia fulva]|uniref:Uncharacterized protein n=1 Tax=Passalora fulva TaxID=5499 RepID=A0A9Q8PFP4_PASFU|nr:uncharacterized protein CLAFUR5_09315 [Fulvia fulva]KAK4613671.1 hypothetical protein CLAFUR4_09220 [Fulvia fulva]KAK4614660.1 hypothetical protein CLAFUR0_09212 [Fulvia fulva]UJO21574.1 hypothetical protein CLAFUR5_09315 [Fulvia fulva]WPV20170.1 hypothetical protein CLAFUW4_09214 [Fulvia fulva]WPV35174.1 hypothetical protein CLAFUW7_09215 [Fulvia fulva]
MNDEDEGQQSTDRGNDNTVPQPTRNDTPVPTAPDNERKQGSKPTTPTEIAQHQTASQGNNDLRIRVRALIPSRIASDVKNDGLDHATDTLLRDERTRMDLDISGQLVIHHMRRDNSKLEGPADEPGWTPDEYDRWLDEQEESNGGS